MTQTNVTMSPLLFGNKGYRLVRAMATTYTVHCPQCGVLEPETDDYDEARQRLLDHAAESHSEVLESKPRDWKGVTIG